jgi:hypothetical protein
MFTVTQSAAQYLKAALTGVEEPENACFRLRVGEQGPDLALDQTRAGDRVVEHDGDVILTVEPSVAEQFSERTLHYDQENSRLVLASSE